MKKIIFIKNGYVIIPENWILLNWKNPRESNNVFVLEIRDLKKLNDLPHFIFCDENMQIVMDQKEIILKKAVDAYPKLKGVLKLENKEDINAPEPMFYQVKEAGYEDITDYPFNVKVYRTSFME